MKPSTTGARVLAVALVTLVTVAPAPAQKKGANEAVQRHLEGARIALREGIDLLRLNLGPEARKLLESAVAQTHKAGKILVDAGPTDAQRKAIGMVLQGTLRVEAALDLIEEARVTGKENASERLAEERVAFKLARAERKAAMEVALAQRKAEKEAQKAAKAAKAAGIETSTDPPDASEAEAEPGRDQSEDGDGDRADEGVDENEDENGDEDGEDVEEEEQVEEEDLFDPEVASILQRALQAALEGQELLERGAEVFPRRF